MVKKLICRIGDKILAITPERELNEHVRLTDEEFDNIGSSLLKRI